MEETEFRKALKEDYQMTDVEIEEAIKRRRKYGV